MFIICSASFSIFYSISSCTCETACGTVCANLILLHPTQSDLFIIVYTFLVFSFYYLVVQTRLLTTKNVRHKFNDRRRFVCDSCVAGWCIALNFTSFPTAFHITMSFPKNKTIFARSHWIPVCICAPICHRIASARWSAMVSLRRNEIICRSSNDHPSDDWSLPKADKQINCFQLFAQINFLLFFFVQFLSFAELKWPAKNGTEPV